MNVLVTGATGFIGSRLATKLHDSGYKIKALVFPGENIENLKSMNAEVITADITKPETLKNIGEDVEMVFHLAARVTDWGSKKAFYSVIYDGTKNVLDAVSGEKVRFIYLSSFAACGLGRHLKNCKVDDLPRKSGIPYNDSKLDAEILLKKYHDLGKVDMTIIRPGNVIGPRSVWVRDLLEKFSKYYVPLFDGGKYGATLVDVDNLVDGILLAAEKRISSGKIYQFRDEWDITWKQYVTDIGAILNKKPVGTVPFKIAWPLAHLFEIFLTPLNIRPLATRLDVGIMGRDNDFDISAAKDDLGWSSRKSYYESIADIKEWVENYWEK